MQASKSEIIGLLRSFAAQRAGIEPGNYGSWKDYRAESRAVTRDLRDARELIRAVEWRDGITADMLREAFRAYSGRLSLIERDGKPALEYCTGQYFPTEYRKAVCAVCAAALWDYMRDQMPAGRLVHNSETGDTFERYPFNGREVPAGDWLRLTFKREFGPRLARRYFH